MPTTTPFQNLITFSRGSNATVTGPNGLIQWAPHNLLTFSESFDNAAWTKTNATVFANQDIGNGTLGPELVANGDFSSGSTGWTLGADWTVSGGSAQRGADPTASNITGGSGVQAGRTYQITWTQGAEFIAVYLGTLAGPLVSNTGVAGTYTWVVTATVAGGIVFRASSTVSSLDNISVKEVTPVAAIAPDGTRTADTLVETAAGIAAHWAFQSPTTTATTYTFSAYIKALGRNWALLRIRDSSVNDRYAWFNLSTGTVGTVQTNLTATITDVGNGWFRCSITVASALAGSNPCVIGAADADNSFAYTGNGTGSLLIWGAQLELGSTATTYNPTTVKNLLGFSEAFDNAAWAKVRTSVVTGAQANPVNGLFNAQKLMEDTTASNSHFASQIVSGHISGTTYTFSIYAKAAGRTQLRMNGDTAFGLSNPAIFNLDTGTVASNGAFTASIQSIGNGWYRCVCTGTPTAAGSGVWIVGLAVSGATSYTGDGNSGIYIYGAQLSDSASLDPYVPTPGAAPSSTAYYGPRFDYDPVTRQPKGILIEEARTNLLTYSEQFDNAAWTKTNTTITANSAAAPDGTMTADTLTAGAGAGSGQQIYQALTTIGAGSFVYSVYVKQGSGATDSNLFVVYNQTAAADYARITVNYSSGVVTQTVGTGATMTAVGNGWWRVVIPFTSTATLGNSIRFFVGSSGGVETPGEFIYAWGAQLEAGAFATSYIPTIASTVTRSADVATITGQNFGQFYQQSAGTFVVNLTPRGVPTGGANVRFLEVNDGTATSRNPLMYAGPAGTTYTQYRVAGVDQANMGSSTSYYAANSTITIGAAYATNDFATSFSGGAVQTDTSGSVVTNASELDIGYARSGAGTEVFCGHIRSIRFIPFRSADFQLQAIST